MGVFPVYTTQTFSGQGSNARANIDTSTDAAAIGAGISSIGESLYGISEAQRLKKLKKKKEQEQIELSDLLRQAEEISNSYSNQASLETDPNRANEIIGRAKQAISSLSGSSEDVNNSLKMRINAILPSLNNETFRINQKIQLANDNQDLERLKIEIDNLGDTGASSLKTTSDRTGRAKIEEKVFEDINNKTSERPNVNRILDLYKQEKFGKLKLAYNDINRVVDIKNAKDNFDNNLQSLYEKEI